MKATVIYCQLNEAQRAEVNDPKGAGWDTETGRLYLRTKDGHYNEESRKVLEVAAEVRAL